MSRGIIKDPTRVIFICSANHSGSTMLDLMLSNGNNKAHSCGELYRIGKHCMDLENDWEKAQQQDLPFIPEWEDITEDIKSGVNVYDSIEKRRDVKYIIDSSKVPSWVEYSTVKLWKSENKIPMFVIVYKSPLELMYSIHKRQMPFASMKSIYTQWYSHYLRFSYQPIVVSYKDLAQKPDKVIKYICNKIEMPYFEGKHEFWNRDKKPQLTGGCSETMLHFFDKESEGYKLRMKNIKSGQNRTLQEDVSSLETGYKKIYYNENWRNLPADIKSLVNNDKNIQEIYGKLEELKIKI